MRSIYILQRGICLPELSPSGLFSVSLFHPNFRFFPGRQANAMPVPFFVFRCGFPSKLCNIHPLFQLFPVRCYKIPLFLSLQTWIIVMRILFSISISITPILSRLFYFLDSLPYALVCIKPQSPVTLCLAVKVKVISHFFVISAHSPPT